MSADAYIVHPDVAFIAIELWRALEAVEKSIAERGYHLDGPVWICIDDVRIASVVYQDEAWYLRMEDAS
jgi:hypothetical protein